MAGNRNIATFLEMDNRQDVAHDHDQGHDADSAEDTDEASESEMASAAASQHHSVDERLEIKEQMYQDKLANLLGQLELCKQRKQPEYLKIVERLQNELDDRLLLNEVERDYLLACAERDCILEKAAAEKEYEEKKAELIENLIADLEDQKKMIEQEFSSMELNGDSLDLKPTVTRKLRRRPNEPLPVPEKRRKPTTNHLTFLLEDKEIEHDLKLITRNKSSSASRAAAAAAAAAAAQHAMNEGASGSGGGGSTGQSGRSGASSNSSATNPADQNGTPSEGYTTGATTSTAQSSGGQSNQQPLADTRIEDGKLWYERRWFHRGQPVHVEGRDISRFSANISAIGVEAICVKKTTDGQKVRIFLSHLRRGKVSIKRRAN
ncbi:sin3 histone deacetylase corepressor complex component SDS3-like [Anopheles stephensi]|uniref:sin3 histone deacetylase corepressor complex component SDS3-like n=1 Tax=Anopheles stephensi TaxID=30069 RepID=UPI0016588E16|nr:sin3 histone deacetylase corepressor complex component SDS3-like [Anopheles stephensi]XP_035919448.1 sin3 histone deacetylase corepressor complex component SDS3-like [Anopheles stephensi]